MIDSALFIAKVEEIAAEEQIYEHGKDGSMGKCDCIGLVIGAIRRAGGQWRGIHGTNYAARQEVEKLKPITGSSDLKLGEVVFKSYEPGQGGYNLPNKYQARGEYCNGDLRDYYHIGIVESVYPLRIRHMTTPRAKMDTSIGKWSYHGKLKKVKLESGGQKGKVGKVTISGGNESEPIRMRAAASRNSSIIANIPQGTIAEMLEGGGAWNQISWDGKTGYVMSAYVHPIDSGGQNATIKLSAEEAEQLIRILDKVTAQLVDQVGRG